MSPKLVIAALALLAYSVNAMPEGHGAVSHQNSNLGYSHHEHHHEQHHGHHHEQHHDHHHHHEHHHEPHHKPHYKYEYAVKDHHTGDEKSAHEQHDGHKVTGEYSLKEADGSYRRVTYVADHSGFHAQVHRTPGHHPHHSHGWKDSHNHGWNAGQNQ